MVNPNGNSWEDNPQVVMSLIGGAGFPRTPHKKRRT